MNKRELIALIADNAGISRKDAARALESLVASIHSALTGGVGKIRVQGLGTFRTVHLRERPGVNPQTGKKMSVPAMKIPRFSAARSLRIALSEEGD
jgi:DNA-binding protein HU-beta